MGLADLHIHTIYSPDSVSSVASVVRFAANHTGLDVIAITDHNCIDGALAALEVAKSYRIEVIPGIEVSTAEGHILALFVTRAIPAGMSVEDTVLHTMELGGLCITPHPMNRGRLGVTPQTLKRVLQHPQASKGMVGVELVNAGCTGRRRTDAARAICKELPVAHVGSSDAHIAWAIGMGMTAFPGYSAKDLRNALIARQTRAIEDRHMQLHDFVLQYLPQLALRYAGRIQ